MLPENVMVEILSRASPKSTTRCKGVCKEWLDIVSDPQFGRHHLSTQPEALMIHECTYEEFENGNAGSLKWLEIERKRGDNTLNIHPVKSLNFFEEHNWEEEVGGVFGPPGIVQIGSVNGLVSYWAECNFIYILNPVLEEYMTLPLPPLPPVPDFGFGTLGYGFGVSTTTGEYKVIRIAHTRPSHTSEDTFEIQVYTVGQGTNDDKWRIITLTPNIINLDIRGGQPGVYLNSHLYWLGDDGQIYGFDLTTEEMSELLFQYPLPVQGVEHRRRRMLGVLKGNLSFFWSCSSGGGFEVWVMKNKDGSNNNNWYKEIAIHKNDINPLLGSPRMWTPMCLIDGLSGTNSTLMLCDTGHQNLVAYCLCTNKIVSRTPILWNTDVSSITAFRPSFVKLDNFKRLGETSCHIPQCKKRKTVVNYI